MNKKIFLIIVIVSLILISGCGYRTISYKSHPIFFEDTGNEVENYKLCSSLYQQECNNKINCRFIINEVVCDNEKCYCD